MQPSNHTAELHTETGVAPNAPQITARVAPYRGTILALTGYALLGAVLVLHGWVAGLPRLTDWIGSGIAMFANTAVIVATAALAIMVSTIPHPKARVVARMLATFSAVIAGTVFYQHVTGIDLRIDNLLVTPSWGRRGALSPGRVGPTACISMLLIGFATWCVNGNSRQRALVPVVAVSLVAISSLSLTGYLLDADPLFSVARVTAIAFPTASAVLALALALIVSVPERQPMSLVREASGAGLLVRRALPFAFGMPLMLAFLRLRGEQTELFDSGMGSALVVLATVFLLTALLWWCAAALSKREAALRDHERSLLSQIAQRRRIEENLARRANEQTALYQFTDKIYRASSLPAMFDAALDSILEALHCQRASILLFDESGVMRFVGWRQLSEIYRQRVEGHSPWSASDAEPRPICIEDAALAELPPDLAQALREEGIQAVAFIPLLAGGRLIGKFMSYYDAPHTFSRDELDLAVTIARQLGFGIERRRADEDLRRAAEEARAASQAKDDFLAALSHELRTPLAPVLLTAGAMEKDPAIPEEIRTQAGMIRRNVQFEARLIDDLLDLTRIAHGKLTIDPVPADLHALIGHALELAQPGADQKNLRIELELSAGEHHVMGDPARLQQVLSNLVNNAIKFTRPGGRIAVTSRNPELGVIALRFEDNGIGIAPAALGRIFGAFEQGGLEGRHRFGGLGLGLSISKAIVEAHGGELRAESAGLDQGASFTVELKSIAPPEEPAFSNVLADLQQAPLRLLIVEDHQPTLTVITRLLERDGHRIVTASSVEQALREAAANECDLIISDLGLPDGTGYELMLEIRDRHGWRGIALSGYGMESDTRKSMEAGFNAHLVKPVDIKELREAIVRATTVTPV